MRGRRRLGSLVLIVSLLAVVAYAAGDPAPYRGIYGEDFVHDWDGAGVDYTDLRWADVLVVGDDAVFRIAVDAPVPATPDRACSYTIRLGVGADLGELWFGVRHAGGPDAAWETFIARRDAPEAAYVFGSLTAPAQFAHNNVFLVVPLAMLGQPSAFYWQVETTCGEDGAATDQLPDGDALQWPNGGTWVSDQTSGYARPILLDPAVEYLGGDRYRFTVRFRNVFLPEHTFALNLYVDDGATEMQLAQGEPNDGVYEGIRRLEAGASHVYWICSFRVLGPGHADLFSCTEETTF